MLKIMQSKISILLLCLTALCFSSCGNSLSIKKTDLSVDIPYQVFEQVSERSAYSETWMPINAKVELFVNDKVYALDSQEYLEGNEASVKFLFKDIPVDSKAYAKISISQDDIPLANGQSTTITIKSGKNELVIPVELVKYSVPRTKYMLCKVRIGADNRSICDYYLCDSPDETIPDSRPADFESVYAYCFDADGYVYAITQVYENSICNYYLQSNKPGVEERFLHEPDMDINNIFCDIPTNSVYVEYYSASASSYKIENINNRKTMSGDLLNMDAEAGYPFVIDNNYLYYFAKQISGDEELKYNFHRNKIIEDTNGYHLVEEPETIEADLINCIFETTDYKSGNVFNDDCFEIMNLFCQDGRYYLLFRYLNANEIQPSPRKRRNLYSYGGIISVDFANPQAPVKTIISTDVADLKTKGTLQAYRYDTDIEYPQPYLKENTLDKIDDPDNLYYYTYSEYSNLHTNHSQYVHDPDNIFVKIYSPSSLGSTKLFGPCEIIAIKPNRLVLSDEGLFFYTKNNIWRFKKVSRYAVVDLQTFTVKHIYANNNLDELPAPVDNIILDNGEYDFFNQVYPGDSIYIKDKTQITGDPGGSVSLGIIAEE